MHHHHSQHTLTLVLTAISLATFAACATSQPKSAVQVNQPFPDEQKLKKLKSDKKPTSYFKDRRTHVQRWKLRGPLPDKLGTRPASPETPWEKVLAEQTAGANTGTLATEGMHCVARQLGEFYLEHDAFPAGALRGYIRSRCGVVARGLSQSWWTWESKPTGSPDKLAREWASEAAPDLRKLAKGKYRSLGIWYGSDDDGAILVIPVARRMVDLQPTALHHKPGDEVVLKGKIRRTFSQIHGLRTAGKFGHAQCDTDDSVDPPQFRVRCEIGADTDYTQIDLVTFSDDTSLGKSVLSNAFWTRRAESRQIPTAKEGGQPQDKANHGPENVSNETSNHNGAGRIFQPTATSRAVAAGYTDFTEDSGDADTAKFDSETFVELVNVVRKRADLEPLRYEAAQSTFATSLVDTYFGSFRQPNDPDTTEQIALGLLAGWKVQARIVSGSFHARAVQSERPEVLLENMLASASGRSVLLDSKFDRLAVGLSRPSDASALGALVTAYRDLPEESPIERVKRTTDTINEIRDDHGASELNRDSSLDDTVRRLADKLERDAITPRRAQRQLMRAASESWQARVSAVGMITQSPDRMKLHPKLQKIPVDRSAVLVAPYQSDGNPWTSYLVYVAYPTPKTEMVELFEPTAGRTDPSMLRARNTEALNTELESTEH